MAEDDETDVQRMDHHVEVLHELQAVIDRVAERHLGDDPSIIRDNLRREFAAAGHWPQPSVWLDAVAEEMAAGRTYRTSAV